MGAAINTERFRLVHWISEHRLGGAGTTRLGFHGTCTTPVDLFVRGLPDEVAVLLSKERETGLVATLVVRCRKCEACLKHRSGLWAARARDEIALASRTWFGTLTLAPQSYMQAKFATELRLTKRGHSLDQIGEPELFAHIVQYLGREIALWLKRVRKNSGARFRYMIVCEKHKSGLPHWHLLVHEIGENVTKRVLDNAWRLGFSQFRLVDKSDSRRAFYVTKYLSKSVLTRVRASKDYGKSPTRPLAERLETTLKLLSEQQNKPKQYQPTVIREGTPNEMMKE
jgi:hypothetical protein